MSCCCSANCLRIHRALPCAAVAAPLAEALRARPVGVALVDRRRRVEIFSLHGPLGLGGTWRSDVD
eukprot:4384156-Pyramimonas_sp.AAC.1